MKALFKEQGASLRVEILSEPEVTDFIDAHAAVLDSGFEQVKMSDKMRESLQKSDWMFSGIKTFQELNEAFPQLTDEDGGRKPFERFLNDVRKVDETYNSNYLRAEYNFAQASAEMAGKWERIEEDGDEYLLQYRTAGDDKVRPEHASLNGVTLPPSDTFWDEYYPPNGWNCRCSVAQVRRDKFHQTDRKEAFSRARKALAKDKKGMFRFNPGKQERTFPAYNPYTISKCKNCPKAKNHAAGIPSSELCEACSVINALIKKEKINKLNAADKKEISKAVVEWANRHLMEVTLPNGQKAKRLEIKNNGEKLIVNKRFFSETFAKNNRNPRLGETMKLATMISLWMPEANLIGIEKGVHHICNFLVYEVTYKGISIQCKVKDGQEKIVYTMRLKNKED